MIPKNNLHKLYLVYGNQKLLIKEKVYSIIEDILKDRQHDWGLERFYSEELLKNTEGSERQNIEDLIIACEILPMLTDRKVVWIDNFEMVKKNKNNLENNNKNILYQTVEKIIKNPPESIWFIFTSAATREQDFSKSLFQSIKKKGVINKFTTYENYNPLNWVIERAGAKGIPLSANYGSLLIDIIGTDLIELDHELEKLSLFLSGEKISDDMIKEHIRGHKQFSVFRMTDALSRKELLPALEILDQQLQLKPREHLRLFSLIIIQFRRLMKIHSMINQFYKESEIINKISLPTFLSKQVLIQARNFTSLELQNIYRELAKLDLRIKFQSSLAPLILQNVFQKICSGYFEKKEGGQ
ncbi:MAG: DNA polymerase III subunit delta [Deltaproteobacteria bacterium]|nr:DNA polymerase III subunit delta [Deltaproteobacteria bacterium]